jgi:hypothetical protein
MRFVALIYGTEDGEFREVADVGAVHAGHMAFGQEAGAAGVLGGGEALQDTGTATTIRDVDGSDVVTDGPFAETKELIAGFWILQAGSLAEVIEWVKKAPMPGGELEIRQVFELEDFGDAVTPRVAEQEKLLRQAERKR